MYSPHRRTGKSKMNHPTDVQVDGTSTTTTTTTTTINDVHHHNTNVEGMMKSYNSTRKNSWWFISFDRARRQLSKKKDSDTLLPTSYASTSNSTSSSSSSPPKIRPLTCNGFLMGGNYYPGKDKKRRHMRRKTLWYRLFCSSPGRKAGTFLIMTYILFWHILMPGTEWLLQVGSMLTKPHRSKNTNWLLHDSTLKIPDLAKEQLVSIELVAARSKLQLQSSINEKRFSVLEKIVPEWYHRNDPEVVKESEETDGEVREQEEALKHPVETVESPNKEDKDKPEHPDKDVDKMKSSRILKTTNDEYTVRTIHTPVTIAGMSSRCQGVINDLNRYSTTLVTQTSLTRLWILNETCTRWKDPIVAVVFISHDNHDQQEDTTLKLLLPSCPNLHIIKYMANEEESKSENYPVNRLRNVGLDAVTTSHVVVMDVDFVPSDGLAATVLDALQHLHHTNDKNDEDEDMDEDHHALVIPAFERIPPNPCESDTDCARYLQNNSSFIPKTFEELQTCVEDEDCIVFQSNINWEGHSTTMSANWLKRKWYEDSEETIFTKISCFHTARYEPYVVLRWCPTTGADSPNLPLAPYYDERFHGYGKNKIELISHLRKQGYQFSILPKGFIVHNPHPESTIKETWNDRKGSDLHGSMDKLYMNFLNELDTMYPQTSETGTTTIKLCKQRQDSKSD